MDQEKIGKFIAACRKENGYTQAALAEKLGITDRAVSKWENGKNMPDVSIMQALCELLKINVNELLTGEHIAMEAYKETAEQLLMEMKQQEEQANKKLLQAETVLITTAVIASLGMMAAGFLLAPYAAVWSVILFIAATLLVIPAIIYGVMLEHAAGYYECPACKKRYVPSVHAVIWSVHYGTTRKLRCPYCKQKGYHKKVLTKE